MRATIQRIAGSSYERSRYLHFKVEGDDYDYSAGMTMDTVRANNFQEGQTVEITVNHINVVTLVTTVSE